MSVNRQQPTLFARAVLIAAVVAGILGVLEILRGLLGLDFAEIAHGVFLFVVAAVAAWMYTRAGAAKR
jgi:uncharacterized membrane protein YvlD (DUF360 family)